MNPIFTNFHPRQQQNPQPPRQEAHSNITAIATRALLQAEGHKPLSAPHALVGRRNNDTTPSASPQQQTLQQMPGWKKPPSVPHAQVGSRK